MCSLAKPDLGYSARAREGLASPDCCASVLQIAHRYVMDLSINNRILVIDLCTVIFKAHAQRQSRLRAYAGRGYSSTRITDYAGLSPDFKDDTFFRSTIYKVKLTSLCPTREKHQPNTHGTETSDSELRLHRSSMC